MGGASGELLTSDDEPRWRHQCGGGRRTKLELGWQCRAPAPQMQNSSSTRSGRAQTRITKPTEDSSLENILYMKVEKTWSSKRVGFVDRGSQKGGSLQGSALQCNVDQVWTWQPESRGSRQTTQVYMTCGFSTCQTRRVLIFPDLRTGVI